MRKIIYLIMFITVTVLIFLNSSLSMSESGKMSSTAAAEVTAYSSIFNISFGDHLEHYLRKLTHFAAFFVQGFLLCKIFSEFKVQSFAATGYILFLGLFTAVIDEYIQSFSVGRTSSVNDILLDFSGIFTIWLAYKIWRWSKK